MLALLTTVFVALGISFLCSILEAALFSIRETELAERAGKGERGARMLLDIKRNHLDRAISAVLVLNTIAHTIGAAIAGAQAATLFGDKWLGLFSAILTILVLVLTEIIPKTFGSSNASRLVTFVAYTLTILMKLLWPVLLLTSLLTKLVGNADHGSISRGEVKAMIDTASAEGLLHEDESRIVGNALRLAQVHVEAVMTPRTVVFKLSADTTVDELLALGSNVPYTRVPLFDDGEEDIIGYVRVPEILREAVKGDRSRPLREFVRPLPTFEEQNTVADAMRRLIREADHIALVHDKFGGMAGIITLEDVLETLLGSEIVDESDAVPDLRKLAIDLRAKRLGKRGLKAPEE